MAIADIVNYEGAFDLELNGPDGEKLGWTWHVLSAGSAQAKKAQNRFNAENHVKSMGKRKKKAAASVDVDEVMSELDIAAPRVVGLVAACVSGWTVSSKFAKSQKDEDFEFTPANVARFLDIEWIFEQADDCVSDIGNFIAK